MFRTEALGCVAIGALLLFVDDRRFGSSYAFLKSLPWGDYVPGCIFVVVGVAMVAGIYLHRLKLLAAALFVGGTLCVVLGALMLVGTLTGSTGVLAWMLWFYVGPHMLLQSAVLSHLRGRR